MKNQNKEKLPIEIIPALLPEDFEHLENEISYVKTAIRETAGYIQIDVVDGMFAPTKTWPYNQTDQNKWESLKNQDEGMPSWESVNFEIDLMVMDQLGAANDWISVGASRLIPHIESFDKNFTDSMKLEDYTKMSAEPNYQPNLDTNELDEMLKLKNDYGVQIILSLNPDTENEILYPYLDKIDGVQFMGNSKIGYHGVKLDEKVLEKVTKMRAKAPNLPIGIDIGVNFNTLIALADAGVTRFSSGSVILKSDNPQKTILDMLKVIRNR